jgi:hypothetical protein
MVCELSGKTKTKRNHYGDFEPITQDISPSLTRYSHSAIEVKGDKYDNNDI